MSGVQHSVESGEWAFRTNGRLYVRARLAGGAQGPESTVTAWMDSTSLTSIQRGQEFPASIDWATGTVTGIDMKTVMTIMKDQRKKR